MHYVYDAAKSHSQKWYRLSGVPSPTEKKNIQPFILDTRTKFRHLSFLKTPVQRTACAETNAEKKHATFQKFVFWNQIQWKEMCGLLYFVVTH